MGLFDDIGKAASKGLATVAKNKTMRTLAVSGAVAGGSAIGGPVGGIAAGAVANAALKSGPKKGKKAKASHAATQSHGSTEIAMRESAPKKGLIASLLSIFGL